MGSLALRVQKIGELLNCETVLVRRTLKEQREFQGKLLTSLLPYSNVGKLMCMVGGPILYVATRILRPQLVLETGIGNGVSSAFILLGLQKNGHGTLVSIDVPNEDPNTYVPLGRTVGWVVPRTLRRRWNIILGRSSKVLPSYITQIKTLDESLGIFLHDSDHSYSNMKFEFETVWPSMMRGGLLFSDDIFLNSAFHDFAISTHNNEVTFRSFGGLRKG